MKRKITILLTVVLLAFMATFAVHLRHVSPPGPFPGDGGNGRIQWSHVPNRVVILDGRGNAKGWIRNPLKHEAR